MSKPKAIDEILREVTKRGGLQCEMHLDRDRPEHDIDTEEYRLVPDMNHEHMRNETADRRCVDQLSLHKQAEHRCKQQSRVMCRQQGRNPMAPD